MKTSLSVKGKLKLVLFVSLCAVLLGCAVFLCFEIFNLNKSTTIQQPQISAPEREVTTTAITRVAPPILSAVSGGESDGLNIQTIIATGTYTGSEFAVGISGYDNSTMTYTAGAGFDGLGRLVGTNAGTYSITISLRDTTNYMWATGSTASITYTLKINKVSVAPPTMAAVEGNPTVSGITATATYTGSEFSVGISGYNFSTMTYTAGAGWDGLGRLVGTNAGTYSITISLRDTTNYQWTDGTISEKAYTLKVNPRNIINASFNTISSVTYNGSAYTPTPTITDNGLSKTLANNTDFTYSYSNNTNAGTATVTITGKGNYTGTKSTTFTINPRNISNATFGTIAAQTYNYGTAITPTPTISDIGISKTLTNNTDFTFSYANNINAGSATITITGKGNYTGTNSTTFTINGRNLSGATIGTITNQAYDGTEKKPTATVTIGSVTLSSSTDFTFSWSNNINAGTATLTVTGKGNYAGTKSATFTISSRNITNAAVAAIAAQAYTGAAKTPVPTVTDLSKTLTRDTDYTLIYSDNIDVGTAKIIITGKGNYTGTKEVSFSITARNISSVTVAAIGTYYYDGAAKEPTPAVTDGGKTLVEGTDFTYSYRNNVDVGTAVVILTGMGNYTGTKEVSFSIQPPTIDAATVTLSQTEYTYDGTAKEPRVTSVQIGDLALSEGVNFTVSYTSNVNAGTAKVVLTGIGDYAGTKEVTFTINPADMSDATINGLLLTYTYTGKPIEPSVTVTLGDKTLVLNTDYLITYENNIDKGTATVTVTGSKNYTGTLTDSFTIVAANINNATVTGINATYEYTGEEITPAPALTFNSKALALNTDFASTYKDNIDLGTATITISGIGNFTGTLTETFEIVQADISEATVEGIDATYTYTGSAIEPEPTVTLNGVELELNTDYTVTYTNNTEKGTATLTITGCGNYKGTITKTFTIGEGDISESEVTGINDEYEYTGEEIAPDPELTYNGVKLVKGTDYSVKYSANIEIGTVTITITGVNNFTGTLTKTFEIVQADISKATITGIDRDYDYTGSAITPEPTVTLNGVELEKGTDYTVNYRNNVNLGAAVVVITGKGNYKGEKETAFTIGKADISEAEISGLEEEYQWTGNEVVPEPVVKLNGKTLVKDTDYTLTCTDNVEIGTAKYVIAGIGNYTGSKEGTFEIIKATPKVSVSYEGWNGTDPLFAGNALPKITATATYNGAVVDGTIAWDGDGGLSEGENSYGWTFTPDDTEHYEVVTGNASLSSKTPTYIAIRAEWKGETQPELFTSSSVSVIKANLKVTGISDDSSTSEIVGGYSFEIVDKNGATTVNGMPTAGGTDFKIIVKFGEWQDTIYSVEIKNVELTELSVEAAEGGIETEYTALDKFDTSSVVVTAKYNDGTEKTVVYGKGGYSVVYEQGTEYLQYDDTKVTLTYTEKGITKTAVIEDLSVSKKGLDEELVFDPDDADYDFGNSLAGGIKVENLPDWLKVTYIYKDEKGNEIAAANVKNAGTYTVTATFTVDKNHKEVDDITATFKINAIEPTITPAVGGSFTAGTALSDLTISGNAEAVAGTLTWDEETYQLKAGTNRCYYTFTPDDTVNFKTVQGYVDIEVDNAPTATGTDGIAGWQIALIIICLLIAIVAIIALIIALKQRKTTTDNDGFYDDVTDADLM